MNISHLNNGKVSSSNQTFINYCVPAVKNFEGCSDFLRKNDGAVSFLLACQDPVTVGKSSLLF